MAHLGVKPEVLALQQRLDRNPVGAPAHRALFELLEELYTPDECRLAAAMPLAPATAGRIASSAGLSAEKTDALLASLVEKGLVVDMPRPDGRVTFALTPVLGGFFEFTMMRSAAGFDKHKAAGLMRAYLQEDPGQAFFTMLAAGPTFLTRTLVHEDALEEGVSCEVLDYEKATHLVREARLLAESTCYCRHIQDHRGQACGYPLSHCLSLGKSADYVLRHGWAQPVDVGRALEILAQARESGNVQMADNVKRRPAFICNCCACCCQMLSGMRTIPALGRVVTSNYLARSDEASCTGCGKCAKACPVDVIEMIPAAPSPRVKKRRKRALVHKDLCIGCGVCHRQCRFDALKLEPVGERAYTPEHALERNIVLALEHGRLQHLLFDDPTRLTHRALAAVTGALLALPPAKKILAKKQVKSRFLRLLLERVFRPKGRPGRTSLR